MIGYNFNRKLRNGVKLSIVSLGAVSISILTGIGYYHLKDQNGPLILEPLKVETLAESSNKPIHELDPKSRLSKKKDLDTLEAISISKENPEIDYQGKGISNGELIRLETINFGEDKAFLNESSFNELDRLADFLKKNPKVEIEIQGHTDRTKSKEYSLALSLKRAEAVRAYLVKKGVVNKLSVKGFGYNYPLSNSTDTNDPINRRVEIRITGI